MILWFITQLNWLNSNLIYKNYGLILNDSTLMTLENIRQRDNEPSCKFMERIKVVFLTIQGFLDNLYVNGLEEIKELWEKASKYIMLKIINIEVEKKTRRNEVNLSLMSISPDFKRFRMIRYDYILQYINREIII